MFCKIYKKNLLKTTNSFWSKNFNAYSIRNYYVASPEDNEKGGSVKMNIPVVIKLNFDDQNITSKYLSLNIAVHLTREVISCATSSTQIISLDVFEKKSSLKPISMFNQTQENDNVNLAKDNRNYPSLFQGV